MKPQRCLALLAPVLVSGLALGPAVAAAAPTAKAPASATAVAKPQCVVSKAAPADKMVEVKGTGFPARKIVAIIETSGEATTTGKVKRDGTFAVPGLPQGKYRASLGKETVKCRSAEKAAQKDAKKQLADGYKDGFALVKKNCKNNKPLKAAVPLDPNYEKGHDAGRADAFKVFCK
jgi:hypothetical protein